ncbi:MAG TPA: DUF4440 domain-containing protein [Gemmatimonadales bacterium]
MRFVRVPAGLAVAALAAGCQPPAPPEAAAPPAVDSAAVRSAVAAFWQQWGAAAAAGDTAAMGRMMTDSVRVDSKGAPPMLGREATVAMLGTMLKNMKVDSEVITPDLTHPISNELAYDRGHFTERTTSEGKSRTEYGRYAAAIRKDPDGQWRLAYIMAFADSTVPVRK